MKQDENEQNYKKGPTPVVGQKPNGKSQVKTSISFLLSLVLLASPSTRAQFNLVTNGGGITISGYTGSGGAIVIPSTTNGMPVVAVGMAAFFNKPSVTSITIPGSVTNIGIEAFQYCTGLTSLSVPTGVISIGQNAFWYCVGLTNVTIAGSVTTIGASAFQFCYALSSLTISNGVRIISGSAFQNCLGLTNVVLPSSVTNLTGAVFGFCTNLTAITVDAANPAYTDINGVLFNKTQSALILYPGGKIGSFFIPGSVATIGAGAFSGCINLTSVQIPSSVTNISGPVFQGCAILPAINVDAANPNFSSVDGVLFDKNQITLLECPSGKVLGNYTIPASVKSIATYTLFKPVPV